ncbi:HEPN domain-containing protein [Desulfonatronum thioautotrophicum]|uniref:HEPN domain-containing protein n=1 Tax=Desulfonatronum thioautotrophicum TaxID=617001 RepID=UPI0005EBB77C|nr:HEPN domain-containing protein [Desulfonatronum thioautotrophicum]
MSEPERILADKARKWMHFAEEDLRLAEHALQLASGCPYRLIAYHAQQCAEKYIKAFLVYSDIDFPYTHNIRKLIRLCGDDIFQALQDADALTPFAVTTRYPGLDDEVSKPEALSAIALAKKVRRHISRILIEKGLSMRESDNAP